MRTRTLEVGGMVCLALGLALSIGASVVAVMGARVEPDVEGLLSLNAAVRLRSSGQFREFDARIAGLRASSDEARLERALGAIESVRRVEEEFGVTAATDGIVAGGLAAAEDALSDPRSRPSPVDSVWINLMAAIVAAVGGVELLVAARRRLTQRRLIVKALGLADVDDDAIADQVALHTIRLKAQRSGRSDAGEAENKSELRVVGVPPTERAEVDPFGNDSFRPTRSRRG